MVGRGPQCPGCEIMLQRMYDAALSVTEDWHCLSCGSMFTTEELKTINALLR